MVVHPARLGPGDLALGLGEAALDGRLIVAAAAALATIPLGLELAASAQVGVLAAVVAGGLIVERA